MFPSCRRVAKGPFLVASADPDSTEVSRYSPSLTDMARSVAKPVEVADTSGSPSNPSAPPFLPRLSRAQKTIEVQQRIDAAALEVLSTTGVDGLALTKVATAAGLSNGPLYGRYDSGEDIALELWEGGLRRHAARLMSEVDDYTSTADSVPSEWLVEQLTTPSAETIAAAEIIAVARRFPMLAETIRNDLDHELNWLRERHPDIPFALLLTRITIPIGAVLYHGLLPTDRPPWIEALTLARDAQFHPEFWDSPSRDRDATELPVPTPDTGDVILDEFVTAVMKVVARVGFEKTSSQRVARAAGHSFSSVYAHVQSKDDLMMFAIGATIDQIVTVGDQAFIGLQGEEYLDGVVALANGLVSDTNRTMRQLRAETLVAASHHPQLGDVIRDSFRSSLDLVANLLGTDEPAVIGPVIAFWHLTRAAGMGLTVLSLNTSTLPGTNWMPYARAAQHLANTTFFDRLRADLQN